VQFQWLKCPIPIGQNAHKFKHWNFCGDFQINFYWLSKGIEFLDLIQIYASFWSILAYLDVNSVSEKSTTKTMANLHSSRPHYRKLPAELERQIYLCFNEANQRKFIYVLGWNFYAMFRHRLLKKVYMRNILKFEKMACVLHIYVSWHWHWHFELCHIRHYTIFQTKLKKNYKESMEFRSKEFGTHTGMAGTEPTRELQSRQMVWMSTTTQTDFQMFLLCSHSPFPVRIAELMNFRAQFVTTMKSWVVCEWIFS
jgi:hypothetical protein